MSHLSKQAQIDRKMCQRSLYYLCKEVMGYKDMVPHVHGAICDFATSAGYGRFRQACVPRSWFKTWVWTVGKSIWLTLPDEEGLYADIYPYRGPNIRILIASNVIDNAAKMINKLKGEWESNARLRAAFPDLIPEFNKTRWSDHCAQVRRTIKAQEGTYTAIGAGGSVISQHFDHIIEDDLVYAKKDDFSGEELMPSQEDIDNAIGWHKLAFSLLSDPQRGGIDNVGTRWAPHDLVAYIREREKAYATFEITATEGGVWPVADDSSCVWPQRYDKRTLELIRDSQGAKIFETQYLNRPRAGDEVTFDSTRLIRHGSLEEYPLVGEANYLTIVDLASWKDSRKICNNVVATGCKDASNNLWIARVDAGHFNPSQVIELIKEHQAQFHSKVLIEEVGYQIALRHFARKDMSDSGQVYNIEALPIDNKKGAKEMRINSLEPVVRQGFLHVLSSMKSFITELEDYPYGQNKDQLDVAGYLWRQAKAKGRPKTKVWYDPFSLEAILGELGREQTKYNRIFDVQQREV